MYTIISEKIFESFSLDSGLITSAEANGNLSMMVFPLAAPAFTLFN